MRCASGIISLMRRNVLVKLSRLGGSAAFLAASTIIAHYHVVGYEQSVDLLHNTNGFLGANRRVRGTLMALYLVYGQLELPARMG